MTTARFSFLLDHRFFPVALCISAGGLPAGAAETVEAAAHPSVAHVHTSSLPHHHVGLFLGGASRYDAPEEHEEETGPALGVEYEYRFASRWGAGLLAEGVFRGHADHTREATLFVPLNFHPRESLKFSVAPGVEFVQEGDNAFVFRLGAAYEWEFGDYNLAPEVALDFTDESQTAVYGLSLGRRF
jgi:hypothetical protein